MKGNVNPFEPWRPVADRIPPPLHAGRPWRPPPPPPARTAVEEPPFVEPVKPLPRNKPPERAKRPQGRTGQPSRGPAVVGVFVFLLLVNLGLASMGWSIDTHAPRVLSLQACAALLGMIALCLRRDGHARLTEDIRWVGALARSDPERCNRVATRVTMIGMSVALALAGIALWFVPTVHGVNLWSAYRQVEELRALPADDVAAYQRGAAARRTLVEDFPSFAADVSAAEQAWLRRTVDEAIENADRQLNSDPDAALAHLHQLDKDLSQLEHYASVRKDLGSARRRAVQACLKVARQP